MKFAVNYSEPLICLLNKGSIEIDLIKCPDWEGMLKEAEPHGPITIHFDLEAGLGNTVKVDFLRIKHLMDQTETRHVNTHLVTPRHFDPDSPEELSSINKLWRNEIQIMIENFGAKSVALEHFPYTQALPNIRPAADCSIFSQVILDTSCMFLLDLAHARITASTLCMDVREYIRALPVDRLVEMHITGVKQHSGILTDHFELSDEDWDLFTWALAEIRAGNWRKPDVVAFEYGGVGSTFVWRTDGKVLQKQVPILYEMLHSGD